MLPRATRTALAVAACLVAGAATRAQPPAGPGAEAGAPPSEKKVIVWSEVTPLRDSAAVDVCFPAYGLNIVNPAELVWNLDRAAREMIAVASKPITGTAESGEEMGRRGGGVLRQPVALATSGLGSFVLEGDGRVWIFRSGWVDSLDLGPASAPVVDLAVGSTGLLYVLRGREVLVLADLMDPKPLWTIPLPAALAPAVALTTSARGDVFVLGRGLTALVVFALDSRGVHRVVRERQARALRLASPGGLALSPAMLLPIVGREGWVGQDRFLVVTDGEAAGLVVLDAATFDVLGRHPLAGEAPGFVPGRVDVSNRGQIAVAAAGGGRSYAFPTRVLAGILDAAGAPGIHWRTIEPDSVHQAGDAGP
jgi:hypothetical protein